jgi:hypothetical protein
VEEEEGGGGGEVEEEEVMWKSIVEPGRPQITIWHMRIAY